MGCDMKRREFINKSLTGLGVAAIAPMSLAKERGLVRLENGSFGKNPVCIKIKQGGCGGQTLYINGEEIDKY